MKLNASKLDFSDVLLVPKGPSRIFSRKQVALQHSQYFPKSQQTWNGVPIFSANMDTVGTVKMYEHLKNHNIVTCFDKNLNSNFLAKNVNLNSDVYSFSTGITENDVCIISDLIKQYNPKFLCIDVANGYMVKFIDTIAYLRSKFPNIIITAGNVVTSDMVQLISESGADIVKLGIGSGSVCTTRIKTGIGYPQFSCITDCKTIADEYGIKLMSDGGITTPGDICKAYTAGADFVMLGSMLAGHNNTSDNIEIIDGKEYTQFYGMSSSLANDKYSEMSDYKTSEGKEVTIPLKGDIENTLYNIFGGIRSCCAYLDAYDISQLYGKSDVILVNNQTNQTY